MNQNPKQWITTAVIFLIAATFALLAAPPRANTIAGTIEIDPSVTAKVPSPATVFVIARKEGAKGPPVLAKRLTVARFPIAFSLGPQDAMMGEAAPPRVFVEARIDTDGDAATHEAGAPAATVGPVAMGATDVLLRLK